MNQLDFYYSSEELIFCEKHFIKYFGPCDYIFHDSSDKIPHVDIYVILPTKQHPYYRLITCGMGSCSMSLPEDLCGKEFDRIELMFTLPSVSSMRFLRRSALSATLFTSPFFSSPSMSFTTEFLSFIMLVAISCCDITPLSHRASITRNCSGVILNPCCWKMPVMYCFVRLCTRFRNTPTCLLSIIIDSKTVY